MNTTWWDDLFQFGDPTDFTWTFSGVSFYLAISTPPAGQNPVLLTLTSAAGQMTVVDPVNRILGMNVSDVAIRAALQPGHYVYDLIMVQLSNGQTDGLMYGEIDLFAGVTVGPS
jgi:hypothetical protein